MGKILNKKTKKSETKKDLVIEDTNKNTPEVKPEEIVKPIEVVEDVADLETGKEYVVVLGTPSFYIVRLEDGSMKTVQGSNTYKRGDIVKL